MLTECRDCCWCGGSSGPGVGAPRRQKEDGSQCARGVGGTSHCCSSNIKPENPSRETGMIKAVQKCRCLSGFPGSVEASKHISLCSRPLSRGEAEAVCFQALRCLLSSVPRVSKSSSAAWRARVEAVPEGAVCMLLCCSIQ